ncbi:methyltransferase domain-containing protein [Salinisphaera dokdonensis CL-ES53]|jgi:SAM-dependent methyltransferase|uniref:Methyltransferase domain-containing protein n=1 Tax=Salinisphaera dokdonensis CL-ES53 TaxID=1304272 RepID=A0ABV2B5Q6_9GAMM|nr:class I SAM-dependent methyltransferase [Salinisphaera sp.]MBS63116.1 SAM-dependent methyltransferase [Salinisphaera sp.]
MYARSDDGIIDAWSDHADWWSRLVRERRIESRRLVTDQAVLHTVLRHHPAHVLDVGCGEGWLARQLASAGVTVTGTDASPTLIRHARELGGGEFHIVAHETLVNFTCPSPPDVIVCNFSLLGETSVETVFAAARSLLASKSHFIVQTLHPVALCASGQTYEDGWRASGQIAPERNPLEGAPWYFRTLANWLNLFRDHQLKLQEVIEPIDTRHNRPASIIFVAKPLLSDP